MPISLKRKKQEEKNAVNVKKKKERKTPLWEKEPFSELWADSAQLRHSALHTLFQSGSPKTYFRLVWQFTYIVHIESIVSIYQHSSS
jgi:hypothetical protein